MLTSEHLAADSAIRQALTLQLLQESTYFSRQGEEVAREFVEQLLSALQKDLAQGRMPNLRSLLSRRIPAHVAAGLTFHDVRSLCLLMRRQLLQAPAGPDTEPASVPVVFFQDWLYELALSSSLYYSAQREDTIADQSAQMELQLGELRAAYEIQERTTELLRQIWIPIAPVYQGVLVVPLVGALDTQRSALLMERLLNEVTGSRARFVLLDISGVPVVDTVIAQYLVHMASAVQLLGAELVLVGISPEIAQTIVDLNLNLAQLATQSNLRDGLQYALNRMGLAIVSRR